MPSALAFPLMMGVLACVPGWLAVDRDGDGLSSLNGDCWDSPDGPVGSALSGDQINPSATETWYDGVDQDCAGDDDYDADHDGYVAPGYAGLPTLGVADSGTLPEGDCWDDPLELLPGQQVIQGLDSLGNELDWVQPGASLVFPGAVDPWYDGVDQDCAGDDDFDADADGWQTDDYPHRVSDGSDELEFGSDCVDDPALRRGLDSYNYADEPASAIHPGAVETWYDGTDQDCDDNDCDADGDGYSAGSEFCESMDCDDGDPQIYYSPDVPETWYNGIDENCDDNDGDQDGDGFWVQDYDERVEEAGGIPMELPAGFQAGDCWDDPEDAESFSALNGFAELSPYDVFPGSDSDTWYDGIDQDCAGDDDFDADGDGYDVAFYQQRDGSVGNDCMDGSDLDDFSPTGKDPAHVNPGMSEFWYDGTDDDCDGNDGDFDSDGYYLESYSFRVPPGFEPGDCDDDNSGANPGLPEDCSTGFDDDCDDDSNDRDAVGCIDFYLDSDGDSFGVGEPGCFCHPAGLYRARSTSLQDCDDADEAIFPGADEYCDEVDNDCDTEIDEPDALDAVTWYQDLDLDGYGWSGTFTVGCHQPPGFVNDYGDCDDTLSSVHPGAVEYCDGLDNDCNELEDDFAVDAATWYADLDGDGYGDPDDSWDSCSQPTGYTALGGDCDDSDGNSHPGARELCDGTDQDCDEVPDNDCIELGSIIFTELMQDSIELDDEQGEWFELYNLSASDLDLQDLVLRDETGSQLYVISNSITLSAGDQMVAGTSLLATPDVTLDLAGSISLADDTGVLVLATFGTDGTDGVVLDRVEWGLDYPVSAGSSMSLDLDRYDYVLNDEPSSWCNVAILYGAEDAGTPGVENGSCRVELDSVSPTGAPLEGGSPVVLGGRGFYRVVAVTFDGMAADFELLSDVAISAMTVPHPAGEVTVAVWDEDAEYPWAGVFTFY